MEKELKFEGGVPSGKLNVPPKSCMPRRAKIRMKRKSSSRREMMDFIELSSEMTKFLKDDQYTVTLKILNSRRALRTDRPKDPALGLKWVHTTSKTLPEMTRQSKRLKDDSK